MIRSCCAAILAAALGACAAGDTAVRPNGLVFNHVLPLADGEPAELPLYLTRRGEYYAEAIVEPAGAVPGPRFDLGVTIARREQPLFERDLAVRFDGSEPATTLFWLTADREVPIKTPLTLTLAPAAVPPASGAVRIQIRRKPNTGIRVLR